MRSIKLLPFCKLLSFAAALASLFLLASCGYDLPRTDESASSASDSGQIFLYGETHGSERVLAREFELWNGYYHNEGMRHLFVEYPYYTAEFLNIWLEADSDDILNALYDDWIGAQSRVPAVKDFFKRIKDECPDTVFHGTDVGHQYNTTGERYLSYLKESGMENTDRYAAALEAIAQGERFYGDGESDYIYREDKMAENFTWEFDKLNGENVMGIYGSAHTSLDGMAPASNDHPSMANQLRELYSEKVHSEDISWLALDNEPLKSETLLVDGKEYNALYFGEQDISSFGLDFLKREFWRLENSYNDFAAKPKTGDVLPYNNYPMPIETGQVFVIDYTKSDGSVIRMYYRSDGNEWNGQPVTEQFEDIFGGDTYD
jgi:hypothetical protein